MRRTWFALVLSTVLAPGVACEPPPDASAADAAGDADAGAGGGDASVPDAHAPLDDAGADAASTTLPFRYTLWAIGSCDEGPIESCPVFVGMALQEEDATPITDATVTVEGVAAPYSGAGGLYQGHLTGYVGAYRFEVTRAGLTSAVTFASASDFDLTLSPAAPTLGTSATVHWTPSSAADHEVNVTLSRGGIVMQQFTSTDDGEETLGADAFTSSGTYEISVERRRFYYGEPGVPGGGSRPNLGLARTLSVEIP